jgi:hypothetical protein
MIEHMGASRGEARSSGVSETEWLDALELLRAEELRPVQKQHLLEC